MINGIQNTYGNPVSYTNAGTGAESPAYEAAVSTGTDAGSTGGRMIVRNPGESTEKQAGKESSPAECKTCSERKYQDGSDEDVSFKAPSHIDPSAAASRVRSHEQEHVNNAYKKASEDNGKVVSCNVSLRTSVCPECGRTYVSGGTTKTQIKYYNEDNPYQKEMKSSDAAGKYRGMNLDAAF